MSSPIPECQADAPLFEVSPLRLSDIQGINPLGNLNPPGHTFPSQHLYFYIRREDPTDDRSSPVRVPVFAPGHMWITSVSTSEYLSASPPFTDYSLYFSPCNQVSGYFHHVQTLTDDLLDRIGPYDVARCNTYSPGGGAIRRCDKSLTIEVQAGELIGTTGDEGNLALDFGMRDDRVPALADANPSRHYSNRSGFDQFHLVCAIDYYPPDVRDRLRARLGDHFGGRPRTIEPICGEVEQDEPGTAQGKWYRPGTVEEPSPEGLHLALVHDNVDPSRGVFSVGTSVPGLGPNAWFFAPQPSGGVNRDFSQVTADGAVFCYDPVSRSGRPPSPPLVILLQLTSDTTLRIEKQDAAECGAGSWAFGSNHAVFER